MPLVDLTLKELKEYKPPLTRRNDFKRFWEENVKLAEEQPLNFNEKKVEYFTNRVEVYKIIFEGYIDKTPITAFFAKDSNSRVPSPTIVFFHGYGSSKGVITDYLGWIMLGFSILAVDVRGQAGEAPDHARYPFGNITGNMTKGIQDKSTYYYRYVFMDCYRAIKYVLERKDVDENRVGVSGMSQGGGLSIATAALHPKVKIAMPSVPYLCHFDRAVYVAESGPYLEILNYLRIRPEEEEKIMETLSYFDVMNFAPEINKPTIFSVGLIDTVCPPSTVFATYNHLASKEKAIEVYYGMAHEEIGVHIEKKMKWATRYLQSK
ncbi:MAG: acetylxylan esterase [Nitrososphaeria archaeon]